MNSSGENLIRERLKAKMRAKQETQEDTVQKFEEEPEIINDENEDLDSTKLIKQLTKNRKIREMQLKPDDETDSKTVSKPSIAAARQRARDKILQQKNLLEDDDDHDSPPASSRSSVLASPRRSITFPSSMTSRLREKLAKNVQMIRKEISLDEENEDESEDTERLVRDPQGTTRFDEPQLTERWKLKTETETKEPIISAKLESYDFFTKVYQEEPIEIPQEQPKLEGEIVEEPTVPTTDDAEIEEERKKEISKHLITEIVKPNYVKFSERYEQENRTLFYVTAIESDIKERIFEVEKPRYLEDEGYYVGRRPFVSQTNLIRMENRLLKEKNLDWFGEDGRLIMLPDPLKDDPIKPFVPEDLNLGVATYVGPVNGDIDKRIIDSENMGVYSNSGKYQLNVDINTITFSHHHLFSRENVIASLLIENCEVYVLRAKQKISDYLYSKIRVLKTAISQLKETISNIAGEKLLSAGVKDQELRLREYKDELKHTREQWHNELRTDRELMRSIIKVAKELKDMRKFQGYFSTSLQLKIQKEEVDKELDLQQYENDIREEVEEQQEELLQEYEEKLMLYKEKYTKWKEQKSKKKEAKKREKFREKQRLKRARKKDNIENNYEEDYFTDQEAEKQDLDILKEDVLEKPIKPENVNYEDIRGNIVNLYDSIRRRPGEAILIPNLSNSATITSTKSCPKGELQRRQDVDRCKLSVRILFDNKEVCRSGQKPLGQEFTVRFAQIFETRIVRWPENIKIEIYESMGISTTKLSEIYTSVPDANVTSENVLLDDHTFGCQSKFTFNHEGVGSGQPISFSEDNSNCITVNTTGKLTASVCWAVAEDGSILVPKSLQSNNYSGASKSTDPVAAIGVAGMADLDKLRKWVAKSRLDPNDPNNADLMYYLRQQGPSNSAANQLINRQFFRLDQLQADFDFVTDEEIERSKRFKLITLREQEVKEFHNYKNIPLYDKEIAETFFDEYDKRKRVEKTPKDGGRAAEISRYMTSIKEQITLRFKIAAHQKKFEEIINEDPVPDIQNILPYVKNLLKPRTRPLLIGRKPLKQQQTQNITGDIKLLVNIIRATNIPVREEAVQRRQQQYFSNINRKLLEEYNDISMQMLELSKLLTNINPPGTSRIGMSARSNELEMTSPRREGTSVVTVRPVIEILFQDRVYSTTVADGANPTWNESLAVAFRPPNNSPSTLQTVKDTMRLSIFDECILEEEQTTANRVSKTIYKRWLGGLEIPFSTVYFNGRIEGNMKLKKPPILLGYIHETLDVFADEKDKDTYVNIFVTMEPLLNKPEAFRDTFDSNEDPKVVNDSDVFLSELKLKFPRRDFKTLVIDINGKSTLMSRFIKPLEPPANILPDGANKTDLLSMQLIAKFVSMIPFVPDTVVFPGLCDIWATSDQFLTMLEGDEEEHAVLLCNYFLWMGITSYLVIGFAIPEGPTAYVYTTGSRDGELIWNASNGEFWKRLDQKCALKRVNCLVNDKNIWANIQPYDEPYHITFDVTKPNNWKALYKQGEQYTSIQPDVLYYKPTDKMVVLNLKDKLENEIREQFMSWRSKQVTPWNRYCMQTLRSIIERLENNPNIRLQETNNDLGRILSGYEMIGYPINLPYANNNETIIEAVKATGVHTHDSPNIEFAVAVHIHAYPSSVMSVWIFIASLVQKRI